MIEIFFLAVIFTDSSYREDECVGGKLEPSTWSQQSRDRVRAWITACDEPKQHPNCDRPRIPQNVPTRLLDLQPGPSGRLRVVNTKETGVKALYVTLSHCWGLTKFVSLTQGNLAEYSEKGVPAEEMRSNQNFLDAIEVARDIGVRYIWIDSLCIIQNDRQDWEEQAPLMHQVYRNSYCNIAGSDSAGGGQGVRTGLFRDRTEAYKGSESRVMTRGRWWHIVPADLWQTDLLSQVLYTRGWVFQERMLSPRMLHFTAHQIFWDCATVSACEAFPSSIPQQLDFAAAVDRRWRNKLQKDIPRTLKSSHSVTNGEPTFSSEIFWREAVHRYTSCQLTKHDDKLKAMWGIAKLVRDIEEEDYGAGLWAGSLVEQLAWTVAKRTGVQRVATFPSWSWASIKDGLILTAERYPAHERFYEVKDRDGQDISFNLERSLYPASDVSTMSFTVTSHDADMEPVLVSPFIQMRCLLGTARSPDYPIPVGQSGTLQVFLDESKNFGWKPYHFVILAASEIPEPRHTDGEKVHGKTDAPLVYSGIGLLVERVGGDCFRRFGSFKFEGLSVTTWLEICTVGGQPGGTNTKINAQRGYDIWLV